MTKISDLSPEMVEEILSRIPLNSLVAVRLTSTQWNASLTQVVCKGRARARDEFLGFMKLDSKVCSVRFQGELEDLSINQVAKLNQFQVSQVFHCRGLLLCVSLDFKKLLIWNPYLNQTRIIEPTNPFHGNNYGIGYDSCGRYKILRFLDCFFRQNFGDNIVERVVEYEIYDLDSNSWRGLDVNPDWDIDSDSHGVSVKGRTYWIVEARSVKEGWDEEEDEEEEEELRDSFLLCFDYTRERFRSRLKLPVDENVQVTGILSCVREEQLALLFYQPDSYMMEIWVTTKIELHHVSWSKFLVFDMTLREGIDSAIPNGSFVIDEDKKVAMVFDVGSPTDTDAPGCNIVYIVGEDGYYNEVDLEPSHRRPSVCSYVPCLVQIEETARV